MKVYEFVYFTDTKMLGQRWNDWSVVIKIFKNLNIELYLVLCYVVPNLYELKQLMKQIGLLLYVRKIKKVTLFVFVLC